MVLVFRKHNGKIGELLELRFHPHVCHLLISHFMSIYYVTGTVLSTGNHGLVSRRDTSTESLHDSVPRAGSDGHRTHVLAQGRGQILPETVTGLKEEIFERVFKKQMQVHLAGKAKKREFHAPQK